MRKQWRRKKLIIGVTGSFGSGKTTVARDFGRYGVKVIDADAIGHRILAKNASIREKIIRTFGESILGRRSSINRARLGEIVFNNRAALGRLNRIMHPEIIRVIKRQINGSGKNDVILDAPLLLEAGLRKSVDKLVVVKVSQAKQVERLSRRAGLSRPEIFKRINAQIPMKKKLCAADFVIDNNGTKKETRRQVERIRRMLWKS